MNKLFVLMCLMMAIAGCTYNFQPASLTYTDNSKSGTSATYTTTTY